MINKLSNKTTKLAGALLLGLAVSLTACDPDTGITDAEAEVDVPSDQAAVPEGTEAASGAVTSDGVSNLVGQTVTVSTKVTEVLSPNLFTVYDNESMQGQEILAATDLPVPAVGDNVELTGDVMEMDPAAIKSAYNIDVDPNVVEAYTGKPYIAVKALEPVD